MPEDTLTETAPVGVIPATSDVTATGAFDYEVPLVVPPGRADLQPSLALAYDSHATNGTVGVGWALRGTDAIVRCGHNQSRDLKLDRIHFDQQDNFCLGREKLVKLESLLPIPEGFTPPANGFALAEYRTERESHQRIVAFGNLGGITSWAVFTKGGRIRRYGEAPTARMEANRYGYYSISVYGWLLSSEEDRRNNSMHFEYEDPAGTAFRQLKSITYTHSTLPEYSSANLRRVDFVYEPRPDPIESWVAGMRFYSPERLKRIEMRAPSSFTKVREYRLDYQPSSRSKRSLLSSLTLCDGAGKCIPPTTFEYAQPSAPDPVDYKVRQYPITSPMSMQNWTTLRVADLDGDGFSDAVYDVLQEDFMDGMWHNAQQAVVRLSHGGYLDSVTPLEYAGGAISQANLFLHDCYLGGDFFVPPTMKAFDYRSSGRSGFLLPHRSVYANEFSPIVDLDLYSWNAGTQTFKHAASLGLCDLETPGNCVNHILDFDGDGLEDFLQRTSQGWQLRMNVSKAPPADAASFTFDTKYSPIQPFGDGRESQTADLDGNGTEDLLDIDKNGAYRVVRLEQGALSISGIQPHNVKDAILVDVNGDGLKDLFYPIGVDDKKILDPVVVLNTGNEFGPSYTAAPMSWPFDPQIAVPTIYQRDDLEYYVSDFNGDGREDVLVVITETASHEYSSLPPSSIFLEHGLKPLLWKSDGHDFEAVTLGDVTELTYHPLARWSAFQVGDVDGDTLPDLAYIALDGSTPGGCGGGTAHSDDCIAGLSLRVATQPRQANDHYDRMISVTDGYGATERVEYRDHAARNVADPSPITIPGTCDSWLERCPVIGGPVVDRHVIEQPTAPDRVHQYRYWGKQSDPRGRGGLGFDRILETDLTSGVEVETEFDLERSISPESVFAYPLAGLPYRRTTRTPLAGYVHKVVETFNRVTTWLDGKRFVVEPDIIVTKVFEGSTLRRTRTVDLTVDQWGNERARTTATTAGFSTTTSVDYVSDPNEWLFWPKRSETTSKAPDGESVTRVTGYDYDWSGLLKDETREPDTADDKDVWLLTRHIRRPDGQVERLEREDGHGEVRATEFAYDTDGVFLEHIVDPEGLITEYAYHPGVGKLALERDANGVERQIKYDGLGRITGNFAPDQPDRVVVYQGLPGPPQTPMVQQELWATGAETITYHDELGRKTSTQDKLDSGAWSTLSYGYDSLGRLYRWHFTEGSQAFVAEDLFDNLNRRTHRTWFDGSTESWTYPQENQQIHVDQLGRVTTRFLSPDGLLTTVARQVGATTETTQLHYRPFRLPKRVENPLSQGDPTHLQTFDYDVLGRRTLLKDPNQGQSQRKYNAFGDARWQKDAKGNVREFSFDKLGRVTQRSSEDGTDVFVYDSGLGAAHQLSQSTSADGVTVDYEYNTYGLPERRTYTLNGEQFQVDRLFDTHGRPLLVKYPELPNSFRLNVQYKYSGVGQLESVTNASDGVELWHVLERDRWQQMTRATAGAVEVTQEFSTATRKQRKLVVAEPGQKPLIDMTYTQFDDGRLKDRYDGVLKVTEDFLYDDVGRLERWGVLREGKQSYRSYDYDAAGRLIATQDFTPSSSEPSKSYTYSSSIPFAAVAYDGTQYTYDSAGRQETRSNATDPALARTVSFNSHNLPRSGSIAGQTFEVNYDATGDRVRKVFDGETITIDGLYERRTGDGKPRHLFFVHGEQGVLAQLEYDTSQATALETCYLIADPLGSVIASVDDDGKVGQRVVFAPFGSAKDAANGEPVENLTTSACSSRGFTGHQHDDELGWIHMGGRAYDPTLRRFMSPDPMPTRVAEGMGLDRFAYASNDPLNRVDPTGFQDGDGEPDEVPLYHIELEEDRMTVPPPEGGARQASDSEDRSNASRPEKVQRPVAAPSAQPAKRRSEPQQPPPKPPAVLITDVGGSFGAGIGIAFGQLKVRYPDRPSEELVYFGPALITPGMEGHAQFGILWGDDVSPEALEGVGVSFSANGGPVGPVVTVSPGSSGSLTVGPAVGTPGASAVLTLTLRVAPYNPDGCNTRSCALAGKPATLRDVVGQHGCRGGGCGFAGRVPGTAAQLQPALAAAIAATLGQVSATPP